MDSKLGNNCEWFETRKPMISVALKWTGQETFVDDPEAAANRLYNKTYMKDTCFRIKGKKLHICSFLPFYCFPVGQETIFTSKN